MNVGAIVFSRMSSSRLPGKALLAIGDRPLVGRVLDRVRRAAGVNGIALATSASPEDDPLALFAEEEGVHCFRGSLDNVVERGLQCARAQGWTAFARVCGDRVFLDPGQLERAAQRMKELPAGTDLLSNLVHGRVAPGMSVEVVRTAALERVLEGSDDPEDLEHLTRYLYANPDAFVIEGLPKPPRCSAGLRFVVDTEADLRRARAIVAQLDQPERASTARLSRMIREWERSASAAQASR